jgi:epoxyqueuosine reductase
MASALQAEPRPRALGAARDYPSHCTILEQGQAMSGGRVSFRDQARADGHAAAAPAPAVSGPTMRTPTPADRTEEVKAEARRLGFHAVGIARADATIDLDMERYDAFVAAGMHGEMEFLSRNRDARARMNGDGMLAGAKSVICVARRYPRRPPSGAAAQPGGVAEDIALYARGRDYHRFLRRRLRRLAALLRTFEAPDGAPVRARPLCDEEPILERVWAARAGLGFVGKNGLLIVPGVGSMVLLGEVVTTLELTPDTPMAERCGTCTRCLDACPTQAFVKPFVLDPRRCIAYLTIEHRSAVPAELAAPMGEHLFGCDDCQTVCPFNAGAAARAAPPDAEGDPFAPLERWSRLSLEDFLAADDDAWRVLSEGSPLKRAGRVSIARNAAIVLGNRGASESLPALHKAAVDHDDARVREAARAAIHRIVAGR